jgi:hypothetical protein
MAQEQRPPVFELHIRPMLRLLDREHMLTLIEPGFDLWELGKVWEMRNDILLRLRGEGSQNMPGLQVGGPWPTEWIDLFERWTQNPTGNDIGHHLVLAQPDGPYQLQPLPGESGDCRPRSSLRPAAAVPGSSSTPSPPASASTRSTLSRRCRRNHPTRARSRLASSSRRPTQPSSSPMTPPAPMRYRS